MTSTMMMKVLVVGSVMFSFFSALTLNDDDGNDKADDDVWINTHILLS